MLAQHGLSALMILLGLLGVADGWRLANSERGLTVFDEIGPDRYLMGVAALLTVLGAWLLVERERQAPEQRASTILGATVAGTDEVLATTSRLGAGVPSHLLLLVALVAYTAALPWLGYVASTLIFLIVAYRVAGVTTLAKSVGLGIATTAVAYWVFVRVSEMPLPTGLLLSRFGL